MPSAAAQAALIRQTYGRAGLDLLGEGRPQYFEAHGTGTPAGDPVEAEAISRSFSPETETVPVDRTGRQEQPLYVGSIKTVLGHTEGTAGLASLLKASLALQNGLIPPNLLFTRLNPAIEPFYRGLQVPTAPSPWPAVPEGQPRRASVNSFGFGGANAHAIVESFDNHHLPSSGGARDELFGPYVFSANSEQSLAAGLEAYSAFLAEHGASLSPRHLAWTLRERRSALPFKLALPAGPIDRLKASIDAKLQECRSQKAPLGTRSTLTGAPRVLAIFTGQGAQYARMGAEMLEQSPLARSIIEQLEGHLAALPEPDRPSWSLAAELRASPDVSRLHQAALSQPLCTAVQIVLVELLRAANVQFASVVGHSSGEIGGAYAAGMLSARDAMHIAYYRGLHAVRAQSPNGSGIKGAMLAVGTSMEDAKDILAEFAGQATLAACNSSASVTISGDQDAIDELEMIFGDEKKFRRKLKVDTAYHSEHMLPCAEPYVQSLRRCGIQVREPMPGCVWQSTVYTDLDMRSEEAVSMLRDGSYWSDNMVRPVLFFQGLRKALTAGDFDVVLEVGPHPALKGPASQTIQETLQRDLPYHGTFVRGTSAIESFSATLGFLWSNETIPHVNLEAYETAVSGNKGGYRVIKGLPSYQWNHEKTYWQESRRSRNMRTRKARVHQLLGDVCPDSSPHRRSWRNVLLEREIPWLGGHQLQGRTVFPAAGYVSALLEAAKQLARDGESVRLIDISDFRIHQAMSFDEDDTGIETLIALEDIRRDDTRQAVRARFAYSSAGKEADVFSLMASATVEVLLGEPAVDLLRPQDAKPPNLVDVTTERFYSFLGDLGYGYDGPFRTLSNLRRKLGRAVATVGIPPVGADFPEEEPFLAHPGTLDCAIQAIILAFCHPNDGQLWSLHVPTVINRIRVNPALCGQAWSGNDSVPVSAATVEPDGPGLLGDADIFGSSTSHAAVQIEGVRAVPFAAATAADDDKIFARMRWADANADGEEMARGGYEPPDQHGLAIAAERTAIYYLRKFDRELPSDHPARNDPTFGQYLKFARHMLDLQETGRHKHSKQEWVNDTWEDVLAATAK